MEWDAERDFLGYFAESTDHVAEDMQQDDLLQLFGEYATN